jgi:hypothetical protein
MTPLWSPWPETVPHCGPRHAGALDVCLDCSASTWVVYGRIAVPLCLACARRRSGLDPLPQPDTAQASLPGMEPDARAEEHARLDSGTEEDGR